MDPLDEIVRQRRRLPVGRAATGRTGRALGRGDRGSVLSIAVVNGTDALDGSTVAALEPDTGGPIWETTVHEPVGPPAVGDGVIYAGGGHPSEPADETGHLFALEAETGDVLWEIDTDGAFAGHPLALVEDVVVIGTRTGVVVFE